MTAINVHGSLVVVKPKPLTHETQTKCKGWRPNMPMTLSPVLGPSGTTTAAPPLPDWHVNRTREKRGESDAGVILMRRMLKEQAQIVADGGDPKCVFRDPERNPSVKLPAHRIDRKITFQLRPNQEPIPFQYDEPPEAVEAIQYAARTWWES